MNSRLAMEWEGLKFVNTPPLPLSEAGPRPARHPAGSPGCHSANAPGADVLRCAHRHLAVASWRLASLAEGRDGQTNPFAAASARFRSLAELSWRYGPETYAAEPYVVTAQGRVRVADLFASALLRLGRRVPTRSVDSELVHEAEELLKGLVLHVPELA